ncbi:MAG TPA: hypothetical protein VKG43_13305 [Acidimicrobiales bacterium]|nr:hypothetical protein [Acidimicrobiales bacterium]
MAKRRTPHRSLSLSGSHWRADGAPKVRYGTEREAQMAAAERGAEGGVDLGVYRCEYCSGWHMGRTSPRQD